ncbi:hypothetical protein B0181_07155 [Moraxella caviae]|uniref:Uncharacterized protein n=1 Tax=Moraxella caviae TaxID=34060 RepID=A0A1T0A190_9GAMM|nr:hypothetical protein [Moraxella caviae]OOR89447.1 hypothetical protein B0181_07155 [Moraxella caviae]STZ09830.1 Uncharacterised protein [Moraxella caviae]
MSSSTIAIVVVLLVAGFFLGNMFAAKPRAHEVRTADFRLLARQMRLNPRLVARPEWLPRQTSNSHSLKPASTMIAQYSVIDDAWRLPLVRMSRDGFYQPANTATAKSDTAHEQAWQCAIGAEHLPAKMAEFIAQHIPKDVLRSIIGVQFKANSVIIYWHDERYQSDKGVQPLDKGRAQADLNALYDGLVVLATKFIRQ